MDDMDAKGGPGLSCDLLVVGGGINGAGIARDAAGRGLRVILCEQHDLAQHTSSASTKLIHGGLRYLEYYEFSLVRKALREREILLRSAPHIMWPLRFVMPHDKSQRPAWLIRIGLFIYDHLAQRRLLPASQAVNLRQHVAGAVLKDSYRRGFVYSDGWVDDARLVVLNALDAAERGAHVMTRTACTGVVRAASLRGGDGQGWHATLRSELPDGGIRIYTVAARAVVNAAGPWAAQFARLTNAGEGGDADADKSVRHHHGLRLVKGSHIIVPRLYEHEYAYLLQNPDRRIIFAIPYQHEFTLIGTTDLDYAGDPAQLVISPEEIDYLCGMANRYFKRQLSAADVVSSYSGVRPLLDDETPGAATSASAVTRDYLLECSGTGAPLLSVWGGKITTYRKLAEEAMALLAPHLQDASSASAPALKLATAWTDGSPLPGGDLEQAGQLSEHANFDVFLSAFRQRHPWLPEMLAGRYARAYGTRAERLLTGITQLADLGRQLAPGLYEAEAHYLYTVEWARTAEDVLWRRTKLGLHCNAQHVAQVAEWMAAQQPSDRN